MPKTILLGAVSAGFWPAVVLTWRLSSYADHQRFRGMALLDWIDEKRHAVGETEKLSRDGSEPYTLVNTIRPRLLTSAAGILYLLSLAMLFCAANLVGWICPLLRIGPDTKRILILVAWGSVAAATLLHGLAAAVLHQRVARFVLSIRNYGFELSARAWQAPRIDPRWLFVFPVLAGLALGLWQLWWPLGVSIAMMIFPLLAAEQQRGYITVADRRLRYAIARRIAAKLYPTNRNVPQHGA